MAYASRSFGFSYMLTPVVKRLMIANVAIFFVTLLVGFQLMIDWFAFQPTRIIFRPPPTLGHRHAQGFGQSLEKTKIVGQ